MEPILTDAQLHLLRMIFDRGTEAASQALSKWLGQEVRLAISDVELVELDGGRAARPAGIPGRRLRDGADRPATGLILLVFEDRSGLALVDLLLHQPIGTTTAWGELEQSAAKETTNIVGCAYVNALAAHLPGTPADSARRHRRLARPTSWSPRRRPSCTSSPAACSSSP